jgi:hypothetical protein
VKEAAVSEASIAELQENVAELREQVTALTALVQRNGHRRPALDEVDDELAEAVGVLGAAREAERRQLTAEQAAVLRRRVSEVQGQLSKGRSRRPGGESYVNLTPKQVQPKWATVEAAQKLVETDQRKLQEAELGGGPSKDDVTVARGRIGIVARQRLAAAVAAGDSLPAWLSAAVGSIPRPDPEPWVKAAHQVLVFRLEHDVTDLIPPLGPKPGGDDAYSARKAADYKKVAEELNKLHQLGGACEFEI